MKITDKIKRSISQYQEGEVFTFGELNLRPEEYRAGVKALSRMVTKGVIKRASTGKYYKPTISPFGELRPGEEELLRTYLFRDGKRIAYITGNSLYNRLGLTTQIPKTIKIASRDKRIITKIGNLKVKPVKSYVDVTDENYKVLELLDAIKDFKEIPDRNTASGVKRLQQLLNDLSRKDLRLLINTSLHYPPRARALAGALLDNNRVNEKLTNPIANSLNPLSVYNITIPKGILPRSDKWKIE